MWEIPEMREELLGKVESLKVFQIKMVSQGLIERLARPAVNIFIEKPRSQIVRIRVMEEFQMELLSLDKFIVNDRIEDRGIVNFLANGELKKYDFNFGKIHFQQEISELKFDPSSGHNYEPYNVVNSKFNKLKFSPLPERFEQVHTEIEEDINEFLNCMKNSVFYWSGIQRYYGSELDKIKRAFVELQTEKQRWAYYYEDYINENDPNDPILRLRKQTAYNRIQDIKHMIEKL